MASVRMAVSIVQSGVEAYPTPLSELRPNASRSTKDAVAFLRGNAMRSLPQRRPVTHLDRQHVFTARVERAEEVARTRRREGELVAAILLPDQVERTPEPPFPAQHEVRTERALVEVLVVDVERLAAVSYRVRPVRVARDRRFVRTVHEQLSPTRCQQLAEAVESSARGKRLHIGLKRQVGREGVVQPELTRDLAQVHVRKDVPGTERFGAAISFRGDKLTRLRPAAPQWIEGQLPAISRAQRKGQLEVLRPSSVFVVPAAQVDTPPGTRANPILQYDTPSRAGRRSHDRPSAREPIGERALGVGHIGIQAPEIGKCSADGEQVVVLPSHAVEVPVVLRTDGDLVAAIPA